MMKNLKRFFQILLLSLFASNYAAAGEVTPDTLAGTTKVSAEQVIELVDAHPDLVIIDSRKSSDHAKGYIEGSVALPNTETTPATLAQHVKSKSTPVLFYCNGITCGRSVEAAKIAIAAGYTKIFWFRGGWAEWTKKGLPVTKG